MNIIYQEQTIDQVFKHFADGYRLPKGTKLYKHEATYDPRTGKVIFKLFVTAPLGEKGDDKPPLIVPDKTISLPG